jgi:hypothetical protein
MSYSLRYNNQELVLAVDARSELIVLQDDVSGKNY